MTFATPAVPTPDITVEQVDRRTVTVPIPANPEELAERLLEAGSEGFAIVGINRDEGDGSGLIHLERKVNP